MALHELSGASWAARLSAPVKGLDTRWYPVQPFLRGSDLQLDTKHLRAATSSSADSALGAGLSAALLGFVLGAAWCRLPIRSGSGRIVVRGRNYEKNIKLKKGPAEAKKAKITAKHLKVIMLACKEGGADESINSRLKNAIKSALKDNVPRSTIDNRLKKFTEGSDTLIEIVVGGYAQGGAAFMVECVTDNNSRCRTEVREAFKAAHGSVGNDGCVDHLFKKTGILRFEGVDEETIVEASMEAEVEDCVAKDDGTIEVTTEPENFSAAAEAFADQGLEPSYSSIDYVPLMDANPNDEGTYETKHLLHLLDDIDDVQDVHHNAILPESPELMFSNYGIPFSWERAKKG